MPSFKQQNDVKYRHMSGKTRRIRTHKLVKAIRELERGHGCLKRKNCSARSGRGWELQAETYPSPNKRLILKVKIRLKRERRATVL